jgi:uncharacterized protein
MKEFVIRLLKKKLSPFYYYHNYEHTLYVLNKAVEIAKHENCTPKEIRLLRAAALWHDAGFISVYENHEQESCELAKKFLPYFLYTKEDINKICGMIMATKIPQSPKNKLEEIIVDADLEYLGTDKAAVNANNLFMELQHIDPSLTKKKWDKTQIFFLEQHHYLTSFCKETKEQAKLLYLNNLIDEKG